MSGKGVHGTDALSTVLERSRERCDGRVEAADRKAAVVHKATTTSGDAGRRLHVRHSRVIRVAASLWADYLRPLIQPRADCSSVEVCASVNDTPSGHSLSLPGQSARPLLHDRMPPVP